MLLSREEGLEAAWAVGSGAQNSWSMHSLSGAAGLAHPMGWECALLSWELVPFSFRGFRVSPFTGWLEGKAM